MTSGFCFFSHSVRFSSHKHLAVLEMFCFLCVRCVWSPWAGRPFWIRFGTGKPQWPQVTEESERLLPRCVQVSRTRALALLLGLVVDATTLNALDSKNKALFNWEIVDTFTTGNVW